MIFFFCLSSVFDALCGKRWVFNGIYDIEAILI